MELTSKIIMDTLIDRERGKWNDTTMPMIHVHNATESFLNTAFKDIQKISKKSKSRGLSCQFVIDKKLALPPFMNNKRKFVVRLWEGMGRIMVHVGDDVKGDAGNYVSMIGPEEGEQHPGMQGIDWNTDCAVYVLWYVTDRWWELKEKFVESKTISIA